jgi:transposase
VTVLRKWAARLRPDDQVALEATGNSDAIANLLTRWWPRWWCRIRPRPAHRGGESQDRQGRRADSGPVCWRRISCRRCGCRMRTRGLRRQVTRRAHVVRQPTRIKTLVHAILARNLVPTPRVSDLFDKTGRHWLSRQDLPADERSCVAALLRRLDFHTAELEVVTKELAIEALDDPMVRRLMTDRPGQRSTGIDTAPSSPAATSEPTCHARNQRAPNNLRHEITTHDIS